MSNGTETPPAEAPPAPEETKPVSPEDVIEELLAKIDYLAPSHAEADEIRADAYKKLGKEVPTEEEAAKAAAEEEPKWTFGIEPKEEDLASEAEKAFYEGLGSGASAEPAAPAAVEPASPPPAEPAPAPAPA